MAAVRVSIIDNRLDFDLPDFTRYNWVSDAARTVWEPRLCRISQAWREIEWLAITAGVRRCAVAMVTPEELLSRGAIWAEHGLTILPVEMVGLTAHAYAATSAPVEPGKPFAFRIALGAPHDTARLKRAWDEADQETIGDLLGYPSCCRELFRHVWVDLRMIDTTWPMAAGTMAASGDDGRLIEVAGHPQANILWRWMGPRAVSHLPCRFDCAATVDLADRLLRVGRDAGYDAEMDWLLEILSWPVEWSALHGIAEIKTPVLKVSTRTDATGRRYVVRRSGTSYPAEAATGLGSPYRPPACRPLTQRPTYQRGLRQPLPAVSAWPAWYPRDNGFASVRAMDEAHRPIVALVATTLAEHGGQSSDVLDLGCGNGALLKKIAGARPGSRLVGVEIDPGKVAHAGDLLGMDSATVMQGDLLESPEAWGADRRYGLVLLMPGRLLEAAPDRAARLRARLSEHCDAIVVYAYGDWLTRFGDLEGLARVAGLTVTAGSGGPTAALAQVTPAITTDRPGPQGSGASDAPAQSDNSANSPAPIGGNVIHGIARARGRRCSSVVAAARAVPRSEDEEAPRE